MKTGVPGINIKKTLLHTTEMSRDVIELTIKRKHK